LRVVITRAENEAIGLAQAVAGIGCEPLVAPMLDINLFEEPIDLSPYQGVLITSANAVRALEKATEDRDIPIYCVGPQSRQVAEKLGFTNVKNSFGGQKNMPVFLKRETSPAKGPLLFLHGGNVTGNPIQDLAKMGFRTVGKRVYAAGPVGNLPDDVRAEFEKDEIPEIVTFFSIRTFKMFREVMQNEGLTAKLRGASAVCISPAVADFVREVRWKKVYAAEDMSAQSVVNKIAELKESAGAAS